MKLQDFEIIFYDKPNGENPQKILFYRLIKKCRHE